MEIQSSQIEEMSTIPQSSNSQENVLKKTATVSEIQAWLVSYLAKLLENEPDEIDVTIPFDRYGLDSAAAVGMTGDLEEWLGYELDPTLIYDYPTIEALAGHLSKQIEQKSKGVISAFGKADLESQLVILYKGTILIL